MIIGKWGEGKLAMLVCILSDTFCKMSAERGGRHGAEGWANAVKASRGV
jgi:hypothetical protein